MWAILGDLTLNVLSVTGLDLEHGWTYAEHGVVQGRPRLQYAATDLRKGRIKARFHAQQIDPDRAIEALRQAADRHEAQTLQRGDGWLVGRFVIAGFKETHRATFGDGRPLSAEVEIRLTEWVGADAPTAPDRPAVPGGAFGQRLAASAPGPVAPDAALETTIAEQVRTYPVARIVRRRA